MWNILRNKQNPYLFLEIGEEVKENMENMCVNMVILKEGKADKKMNSHEMQGKKEKILKSILKKTFIMQTHAIFATELSCMQVARTSHQTT